MARSEFRPNPKVHAIFDDLEAYLRFCQDFGYRYDENDLYDWKSYSYQQFAKHQQGKNAKNNWTIDGQKSL